nr:hypothetical protein [Tanacetum cinerariifolium]
FDVFDVESIPSLPIPVWDGDSQREEIDIVTETDNVLPPSVKNDDDLSREEIPVVMNGKDEDVDYSSSIIVILDKVFSLLFAESEDTIFDPGIFDKIQ